MRSIFVLTILISGVGFAQENQLENTLIRGNWKMEFTRYKYQRLIDPQPGDSVLLYRVPKRLKFKKERPLRFKSNGVLKTPQVPHLGCGTVGTFESLWYLKWKPYGTWKTEYKDERSMLIFGEYKMYLVDSEPKKYLFILAP